IARLAGAVALPRASRFARGGPVRIDANYLGKSEALEHLAAGLHWGRWRRNRSLLHRRRIGGWRWDGWGWRRGQACWRYWWQRWPSRRDRRRRFQLRSQGP